MKLSTLAAALLLPLCLAAAPAQTSPNGEQIRAQHHAAAEKYFDNLKAGVKLSGPVLQNDSPGRFTAYFLGDTSVIHQRFGELEDLSYSGPQGDWVSSNTGLPYQFTEHDNPATSTLNLLSNGTYLDPPYWDKFKYVDDVAGGYNFTFTPDGLPPAEVVLYADPADPQYLQLESVQIHLSPTAPDSDTYRSFYYYKADKAGKLFTARETGRELDSSGQTVTFTDYTVESVDPISAIPAEAQFNFERKPIGGAGADLTAPLDVAVDTSSGYFVIPVTFAGSDRTWNFIFDSGASASLFTPDAAAAAQLNAVIKVPAHGHGSRVDFEIGLCNSASIGKVDAAQHVKLAGFAAARVNESNADVLSAFAQYHVDGIMGVSLLHQFVATFDSFGGKVTLIPQQLFHGKADVPTPNIEVPLDVEDLIYFKAHLSDSVRPEPLAGDVVLDTGLQQQLAVLRETLEANGIKLKKVEQRKNTVLGGLKDFDYVMVPQFDCVTTWQNVEATLTNDDKGTLSARGLLGFVGVPFFLGARITVDAFAQEMYVRPLEKAEMDQLEQHLKDLRGPAVPSDKGGGNDDNAKPKGPVTLGLRGTRSHG